MKVKKVNKLNQKHVQCDINTEHENFFIFGETGAGYLVHNSPAIAVGRNENGEFVFTHKANFLKKSEDKPTSPEELEDIFAKRITKDRDETLDDHPKYKAFVEEMKKAFEEFQQAFPEDFRGYFLGDMLYFEKPDVKDENFVFKPNVVEYAIDVKSDLGEKIENSEVGVVIHKKIDTNGNSEDLSKEDLKMFEGTEVFAVPPVSTEEPPVLPEEEIEALKKVIKNNASDIDSLLDKATLKQNQLTDFPKILYSYLNSKVDSGLDDLAGEFPNWLEGNEKISDKKKNRLAEYINERSDAFNALWETVATMMNVKDDVISQLDNQDGKIGQKVGGETGGEGYVLAHPEGDMKLVPRQSFTRINRQSNLHNKGGQEDG